VGLLVAAALAFFGSILPWATVEFFGTTESVSGLNGDGVLTLLLSFGVGTGALLHVVGQRFAGAITAVIASVLIGLIGLYDFVDLQSNFAGSFGVRPGIGLLMVIFAAGVGTAAAGLEIFMQRGIIGES
jgi:hypothetical protein